MTYKNKDKRNVATITNNAVRQKYSTCLALLLAQQRKKSEISTLLEYNIRMHLSEHSVILTCTPKEINRRIRLKVTSFDAGKSSSKPFWVFFSSSCLSRNFLSSLHLLYFFVFRKVFPFLLQNRQVKKCYQQIARKKPLTSASVKFWPLSNPRQKVTKNDFIQF